MMTGTRVRFAQSDLEEFKRWLDDPRNHATQAEIDAAEQSAPAEIPHPGFWCIEKEQ